MISAVEESILDTPSGSLRGRVEQGIACFRAVPYAEPPTGELRFEPPVPARPWSGVRDALQAGAIAPQAPSRLRHVMGDFQRPQSEDCLTLTIWAPLGDAGACPVIVWFHGGAFMTGGGDLSWYDGARLAREGGVVVVGVNYRLGALGFLRASGVSPGNLGLMDQALAVQWVERHIASFGGDPDKVTLMGQSAGSLSIALLLSRPAPLNARRAILMSAPLGLAPLEPTRAERIGEAFLQALAIDPQSSAAAVKAKQASVPELMRATGVAARYFAEHFAQPGDASPPFLPVADGSFLSAPDRYPETLARAAGRMDVLIGTTRDESAAFGAAVADEAMTRHTFEDASVTWARRAAVAGLHAYLYRFDWAPRGSTLGAAHCIELPFVFGTRAAFAGAPMLAGGSEPAMDALSDRVRSCWLAFASQGDPAAGGTCHWPSVDPAWRPCMHLCSTDDRVSSDT